MANQEVEEAILGLVEVGLVKDSGERRDGKIVWTITDKGKDPAYAAAVLKGLEELEEMGEGDPQ